MLREWVSVCMAITSDKLWEYVSLLLKQSKIMVVRVWNVQNKNMANSNNQIQRCPFLLWEWQKWKMLLNATTYELAHIWCCVYFLAQLWLFPPNRFPTAPFLFDIIVDMSQSLIPFLQFFSAPRWPLNSLVSISSGMRTVSLNAPKMLNIVAKLQRDVVKISYERATPLKRQKYPQNGWWW